MQAQSSEQYHVPKALKKVSAVLSEYERSDGSVPSNLRLSCQITWVGSIAIAAASACNISFT